MFHQTKWRGLHELHESSGSICGSAHPAAGGRVDSSSSDHHLLCGHHLRPGGSAASRDTQRQAARDDWWHWKATVGQFNTWKPQCVKFEVTVEPSGGSVERHRHKWMLIFKQKTDRPDRTTFLGMHGTIKRTCCSIIDRNCNKITISGRDSVFMLGSLPNTFSYICKTRFAEQEMFECCKTCSFCHIAISKTRSNESDFFN